MNLMEERLAAIDLLLRWEGCVSNARLRELYQLHFTHASRLIAAYRQAHPEGIVEDRARKRFLPRNPDAPPPIGSGGLTDYVQLLHRTGAAPANLVLLHSGTAEVEPRIFAPVQQSIRLQTGLHIEYRSMTNPKPHWRLVFPHACIQTQGRWHMRAYCQESGDHRDFVLGRISSARSDDMASPASAMTDLAWNEHLELTIEPHTGLSQAQREVVRFERFREANSMTRTVRAALATYVLHELRVAVDSAKQTPPNYLLMLRNPQRHQSWLYDAEQI